MKDYIVHIDITYILLRKFMNKDLWIEISEFDKIYLNLANYDEFGKKLFGCVTL